MDPVTIPAVFLLADKALGWVLDKTVVGEVVSTAAGEVLGGRVDELLGKVFGSSYEYFKNLRTQDPLLNHDLERATREAYLLATSELVRQAIIRTKMTATQPGGGTLLDPGQLQDLNAIHKAVQRDLHDAGNTLPARVDNIHLLLIDPEAAPASQMRRLYEALENNLTRDLAERWLPGRSGLQTPPPALAQLLKTGWKIDSKHHTGIPRDWHSLIAIAFMEKLKSQPRLAAIFEAKILAELAVREPAAQSIASFAGLADQLNDIVVPLQRIEGSLELLHESIDEVKANQALTHAGIEEIRQGQRSLTLLLGPLRRLPRWLWIAPAALVAVVALRVGAVPLLCQLPGVRNGCALLNIGGVPGAQEEALWATRQREGGCTVLRNYLARYPAGAFASQAQSLLASRSVERQEQLLPAERRFPIATRPTLEPFNSEAIARKDAVERGAKDGLEVCRPYASGEFRLQSAEVTPRQWLCVPRGAGVVCGFDGEVLCKVLQKQYREIEVCVR